MKRILHAANAGEHSSPTILFVGTEGATDGEM